MADVTLDADQEPQSNLGSLFARKAPAPAAAPAGPAEKKAVAPARDYLTAEQKQFVEMLDMAYKAATLQVEGAERELPFVPTRSQVENLAASLPIAVDPANSDWRLRINVRGMTMTESKAVTAALGLLRQEANEGLVVPEIAAALGRAPAAAPPSPAPVREEPVTVASAEPASATPVSTGTAPATPGVQSVAPPAGPTTGQAPATPMSILRPSPIPTVVVPMQPVPAGNPKPVEAEPAAAAKEDAQPQAMGQPTPAAPAPMVQEVAAPAPTPASPGLVRRTVAKPLTAVQRVVQSKFGIVRNEALEDICIIENGDPDPQPDPLNPVAPVSETYDERLQRLGIPPRPRVWPYMMSWPLQEDLLVMENAQLTAKQRAAYVKLMLDRPRRMMERAEQINAYILSNEKNLRDPEEMRHRQAAQRDPFFGISWASLLDTASTKRVESIVASWAHGKATTMDGGIVVAGQDGNAFSFRKPGPLGKALGGPTPQAIQLAMTEGQARGWKTMKVTVSHEHAELVMKTARDLRIQCEVTILGKSIRPKKVMVMPPPPAAPQDAPAPSAPAGSGNPSAGPSEPADGGEAPENPFEKNAPRKIVEAEDDAQNVFVP